MDNYNNSYQSLLNIDLTDEQLSLILSQLQTLQNYFSGDINKIIKGDGTNELLLNSNIGDYTINNKKIEKLKTGDDTFNISNTGTISHIYLDITNDTNKLRFQISNTGELRMRDKNNALIWYIPIGLTSIDFYKNVNIANGYKLLNENTTLTALTNGEYVTKYYCDLNGFSGNFTDLNKQDTYDFYNIAQNNYGRLRIDQYGFQLYTMGYHHINMNYANTNMLQNVKIFGTLQDNSSRNYWCKNSDIPSGQITASKLYGYPGSSSYFLRGDGNWSTVSSSPSSGSINDSHIYNYSGIPHTGSYYLRTSTSTAYTLYENKYIGSTGSILETRYDGESSGFQGNGDYCCIYSPGDSYICWFGDSDSTPNSQHGMINEYGNVSSSCTEKNKDNIKEKKMKNYLQQINNLRIVTYTPNNNIYGDDFNTDVIPEKEIIERERKKYKKLIIDEWYKNNKEGECPMKFDEKTIKRKINRIKHKKARINLGLTLEKTKEDMPSISNNVKFYKCEEHYNNPDLIINNCGCFNCDVDDCEFCKKHKNSDSVNYTHLLFYSVMAIKELKKEKDELNDKINIIIDELTKIKSSLLKGK